MAKIVSSGTRAVAPKALFCLATILIAISTCAERIWPTRPKEGTSGTKTQEKTFVRQLNAKQEKVHVPYENLLVQRVRIFQFFANLLHGYPDFEQKNAFNSISVRQHFTPGERVGRKRNHGAHGEQDTIRLQSDTPRARPEDSIQGEEKYEQDSNILSTGEHWKPFSVNISHTSFYGGLVTFSHELHPAKICRIFNACVREDGTIVLPAWMRRHDEILSFDCGAIKLDFSMKDTYPPPSLFNVDLFGSEAPSRLLRNFVQEFLPEIVSLDLLSGDRDVVRTCHSRKGEGCEDFSVLSERIRPASFMDSRIKADRLRFSWVKQFVAMIPARRFAHRVRLVYPHDLFESRSAREKQCFRSMVITRGPRSKYSISRNLFNSLQIFKENSIQKEPRSGFDAAPGNFILGASICNLNVTLVNRKIGRREPSPYTRSRYIPNIEQVIAAIDERSARIPGLNLRVRVVSLEGKPLRFQRNIMQETDMLIAGHGSALANMIFLRSNSTVLELMPYAYYPRFYDNMARYLAHVKHDMYIAHPDEPAFELCMKKLAPRGSRLYLKSLNVLQRYRLAASRFATTDNTHQVTLHNLGPGLDHVPICAQHQQLDTNPSRFAAAIVRLARLRCGLSLAARP